MNKIKEMIKDYKSQWKIYIYYKNQCIKKIRVNEEFEPMKELYILRIFMKKHLFGTNYCKCVFAFDRLKFTDNNKKEVHIEVKIWEGVKG